MKEHWERVFEKTAFDKLGWYEESPEPSLQLIKQCNLSKDAAILNVGTGASTLIDELLTLGFPNIIATDISSSAIRALKQRLGQEESKKIKWIIDDLTSPRELNQLAQVDLWHDRAVLHFFNEEEEQKAYFNLLKKVIKKNGFVIIAAFSLNGAEKCSGLPVYRYKTEMLQEKLGEEFHLKKAFDYTYTMPSGESREYLYTLFQRRTSSNGIFL